MKISISSPKDNSDLHKSSLCGKGEQKTAMIAGKQDIPIALSYATDDILNQIVGESGLIEFVNRINK
jgi:hypothetical protein